MKSAADDISILDLSANAYASLHLAVVCPMANEAETAERFVLDVLSNCRQYPFATVTFHAVLDKASRDGTLDLLRNLARTVPELNVIYAPENANVVDAYRRGYAEAWGRGADWILEIDAGYSHRPDQISRLLDRIPDGIDCVFSTRFARGGTYEGGLSRRYLVSRIGGWLARMLLGVRGTDLTSGFQLFSRTSMQRILDHGLRSQGAFFQTEIKTYLRGMRSAEVPITYRPTAQAVRPSAIQDALLVLLLMFVQRLLPRALSRPE